jgi:hypothetical protein
MDNQKSIILNPKTLNLKDFAYIAYIARTSYIISIVSQESPHRLCRTKTLRNPWRLPLSRPCATILPLFQKYQTAPCALRPNYPSTKRPLGAPNAIVLGQQLRTWREMRTFSHQTRQPPTLNRQSPKMDFSFKEEEEEVSTTEREKERRRETKRRKKIIG